MCVDLLYIQYRRLSQKFACSSQIDRLICLFFLDSVLIGIAVIFCYGIKNYDCSLLPICSRILDLYPTHT